MINRSSFYHKFGVRPVVSDSGPYKLPCLIKNNVLYEIKIPAENACTTSTCTFNKIS